MKVEEIFEAQAVFRHKNGAVETLDDYGRKLFKTGAKAGRRLKHLAKKSQERRKNESK